MAAAPPQSAHGAAAAALSFSVVGEQLCPLARSAERNRRDNRFLAGDLAAIETFVSRLGPEDQTKALSEIGKHSKDPVGWLEGTVTISTQ